MIRHLNRVGALAVALVLPASVALAQGGPPWGMGGGFHIFPLLLMLAILGGLILLAARLARRGCPWRANRAESPPVHKAGLDILNERLARGEIDKVEYEEKRALIMGS